MSTNHRTHQGKEPTTTGDISITNRPSNAMPPSGIDDLTAHVVELEHKLTFLQHAFDQLNTVVLEQQTQIDQLRRENESLRQTVQGVVDQGIGDDLPHEKPPHY